MPFVENQGARIYWDEQGHGTPVLLIMGLSYPSCMWHRTRPSLAAHYQTVAFDNRGVGRSEVPLGPYPIALMASDAAAVLEIVKKVVTPYPRTERPLLQPFAQSGACPGHRTVRSSG